MTIITHENGEHNKIYYVIFEDYLQPQKLPKKGKLLFPPKAKSKIPTNSFRLRMEKLYGKFKKSKFKKKLSSEWRFVMRLPSFLGFLRARTDDGLCKKKTGFEIYCEMASIHGFANFVGATTWQRAFWCLVVGFAILASTIIIIMSHLMNVETPTILYTETTTYPAWSIPFPAVTICNMNRISRDKLITIDDKFREPNLFPQLLNSLHWALYQRNSSDRINSEYLEKFISNNSLEEFLHSISPNCEEQLLRCKWKGKIHRCGDLFQEIPTPHGICCAFNYHAAAQLTEKSYRSQQPESPQSQQQIVGCGPKTGLAVLLEPRIDDYLASDSKSPGYQVLIHDPNNFPIIGTEDIIVPARTETSISLRPRNTYGTEYLSNLKVDQRRCYLPHERELKIFASYSQENCLAECRSEMIFERCGCVPPFWPRMIDWPKCKVKEIECIAMHRDIFSLTLNKNASFSAHAEHFICDCYPPCNFNQYPSEWESAALKQRSYSRRESPFLNNITIENHVLLNVFYLDFKVERLRLDVYENWLSFVGTFGGITGLHMGYSFVSGFEMIFFVFVRPACNWLTKKQIRYRIKKRQQKAAKEAQSKESKGEPQEGRTDGTKSIMTVIKRMFLKLQQ